MSKGNRGLTELTVTPLISRAVTVLRAAVPSQLVRAGAIGINVGFNEFGFEGRTATVLHRNGSERSIRITPVQESAAWMLVGVGAFYESLWRGACGIEEIDEDKAPIPPSYLALRRRFNQDVRRKLNVEVGGCVSDIDRYLHGSITIYL
ncbi:hypothetical protein HRW09_02315 [Streptomyces lunaelactis]|uniref:hypothetical protein n=1 Tax=Streptomyces lunaelactis TaxID=1535768 RepID=UPI001585086F|nr:hypothetical protein [Streptomyces lunaelactis]NUL28421.1 hypothetical protein [Streptomyces lunaelactis]